MQAAPAVANLPCALLLANKAPAFPALVITNRASAEPSHALACDWRRPMATCELKGQTS